MTEPNAPIPSDASPWLLEIARAFMLGLPVYIALIAGAALAHFTGETVMVYATGFALVSYWVVRDSWNRDTGLPDTWSTLRLVQRAIYGGTIIAILFPLFFHPTLSLYFAIGLLPFTFGIWYNNQPQVIAARQATIATKRAKTHAQQTSAADAALAEDIAPPPPETPSTIAQQIAEDLMRKQ